MSASSNAPAPSEPTGTGEHRHAFECFGGRCTVVVADSRRPADAAVAAAMAERALLQWHQRFSRFEPRSELTALNRDARAQVPVSPLMRRVIEAALTAAGDTDGLVDATLGTEIEEAGYAKHFEGQGIGLALALSLAPPQAPASGHPAQRWRQIVVDRRLGTVTRPPGLNLDPGGVAKGVFADELATLLAGFEAYALDCAGDVRLGGTAGLLRDVHIASPWDQSTLHTFPLRSGAVATSGIAKRSWRDGDGRPAHHLLDPRTGAPGVHRDRPGDGAGPHHRRSRGPGQGRRAERSGSRSAVAGTRWRRGRGGRRLHGAGAKSRSRGSRLLLGPGHDHRVLMRRVAGDHVLGGLAVGRVLEHVGLPWRDVDHVPGSSSSSFSRWSPQRIRSRPLSMYSALSQPSW